MSYGNSFGWAIEQLEQGKKVSQLGWNGRGMYIELQTPNENSKMTLPYIYMSTVDGALIPWLASQSDILSKNWVEF